MASVTYLCCDHCGIGATAAGVGEGNVNAIYVEVAKGYKNNEPLIQSHSDLCVDCEKELTDAILRWMNARVKETK